ncbi:hypothetical protein [Paenibacillus spongiae]|uniref:Uncharacterized protein n=1 Tax=Paenibacillus spongiae TaxID=2909671 RepID=A0ABY5S150_9BACL|nr:hypothetical protein [Paenibacillus spongiae]UVI27329.1 hypothetical protein L1F29_17780 [Paenibacillus spongiae]
MYTIGYDFGDTLVALGELRFAVRLYTESNVYAPDPDRVAITGDERRTVMRADGLCWAGNQRKADGEIELEIVRGRDGRYIVSARGKHGGEVCKSMMVEVFGIDIAALTYDQDKREAIGSHRAIRAKRYPGFGMKMPLVFAEEASGAEWYAMTKDDRVRGKGFAVHYDPYLETYALDLAHEEDKRFRNQEIVSPPWHIGRCADRAAVIAERCRDLEDCFHLVPFERRTDIPDWLGGIRLIVTLHGEHWTGHVFNTFADMERELEWIVERIPGREVLAFLPAWDGRYYYNYPQYEPSPYMGGAEGFKLLMAKARLLGIRVVPMLGANALNLRFAEQLGLQDAAVRDEWGHECRINWVDWDYDLAVENDSVLANMGHPDFRRHMIERASYLVDEYGVDGIFLDISSFWANDPRYSPYEGTMAWADEMRARYPGLLLFGENSYDALWGTFGLFHEAGSPGAYEHALYRYTRQSHYLAHPALGRGSAGVHEWSWRWAVGLPEGEFPELIPTLSIVSDTITEHAEAAQSVIEQARKWKQALPGIAGRSSL